MQLEIKNAQDSWVDITSYIAFGGLSGNRTDIESSNTGVNIAGTTIRDKIASKHSWSIETIPIQGITASTIETLLEPESISFRTNYSGATVVYDAYCNKVNKSLILSKANSDLFILSFELIEL